MHPPKHSFFGATGDSSDAEIWGVARKLGIDLARVIRDGDLQPQELGGMLRNCADCWHAQKCAAWQQRAQVVKAPPFCPSAPRVNELPAQERHRPALRVVH